MSVQSRHQALQIPVPQKNPVTVVKAAARQLLASLGIEVLKTRTLNAYLSRYSDACLEIESVSRQFVFQDLPDRKRRVPLMVGLQGTGLSEAMWLLGHLHRSLLLAGDVCEFGVAQGATSALLANEIRDTSKLLWLFDSFKGLPKPTQQDVLLDDIYSLGSIDGYAGRMAEDQAQVVERLRQIEFPLARARIVAGFIEDTIQQPGLPEQVCFAYVDLDFYAPIRTALEFLETRLSEGGFVVVDDYGHFSAGAQTAVDEFVARRPETWKLTMPPDFAGQFAILEKTSYAPAG
jgi:O-methyltransferase